MSTVDEAREWLARVADMLRAKNLRYGDSATSPLRIFSRAGPTDGLRVRIDDKLSRIGRGAGPEDEDVLADLVGYIALLAATERRAKR